MPPISCRFVPSIAYKLNLKTKLMWMLSITYLIIPMPASSQSSHFQSKNSAIIAVGIKDSEHDRLMGFLRFSAYGPKAPGALKMSDQLLNAVSPHEQRIQPSDPKSNPPESACFFSVPERIRLFKRLPTNDPCANRGTSILADTSLQVLYLCKDGQTLKDYDFAQGWNGTGKRSTGDEKTPLGIYNLSPPRKSTDGFHKFIGIGYPTALQRKQGFTGSAVGLHGPSRWARCLGFLNAAFNWTNGCLAVSSDRQIDEIASFVSDNQVGQITILPIEEPVER